MAAHAKKVIEMKPYLRNALMATSVVMLAHMPSGNEAIAADYEELLQRIEQLEQQLSKVRLELKENTSQTQEVAQTAAAAQQAVNTAVAKQYEAPIADTMWHMSGYADVGITLSDQSTDTFTSGKFNPSFHFQYKDLVIFESELELQTDGNGTELALEYSQFDLLLHDNLTLVVGKFLSPVGQFQERLHPSWINKLPSAPAGFGHGGVQPISNVGVMARGGVPVGDMRATYSLAVGNGPRLGHGGVEAEGYGRDDNSNKSLSGRFAILPKSWLELGASFLSANMVGPEDHDTELPKLAKYRLWGFDGALTKKSVTVRFEYLNADVTGLGLGEEEAVHTAGIQLQNVGDPVGVEELPLGVDSSWEAWYLQGSYKLSGLSEHSLISKLEPTIRYGEFTLGGDAELAELSEKRLDLGLSYWIAPSIVGKVGVGWRDFTDEHKVDETLVQFQLSYGF